MGQGLQYQASSFSILIHFAGGLCAIFLQRPIRRRLLTARVKRRLPGRSAIPQREALVRLLVLTDAGAPFVAHRQATG
jgi:hypothetical protein